MWTKQTQPEVPGSSPMHQPGTAAGSSVAAAAVRPTPPTSRTLACLGASLEIKGKIIGEEDLQIDGKVDGPVSLEGRRLTVGRTGKLNSEISAGEVIVHGTVTGNIRARDRVEIRKDGSVIGDIAAARISIEDGAYFKGRIEIDRPKPQTVEDSDGVGIPVTAEVN
ncbi:MAG: polymer-forming cytoskeletal protein [Candidatus Acidiferrales bacterium]